MSTTSSDKPELSILILADIEGTSGCLCRSDSQLGNDGWVRACISMTLDLNAIIEALFADGRVARVRVKDFHRTAFNIFPDLLHPRAELVQGYLAGPVIGIGDCCGFDLLFMVGLHAASGSDGFLAHTLTSRFSSLEFAGAPLTEAELFAASVAGEGLRPAFFSGCSVACAQVLRAMPTIATVVVDKPLRDEPSAVRKKLGKTAVAALDLKDLRPFSDVKGGLVSLQWRDGLASLRKLARKWELPEPDATGRLSFSVENLNQAYQKLIALAYLKPLWQRHLRLALAIFNLWGRANLKWAQARREKLSLRGR